MFSRLGTLRRCKKQRVSRSTASGGVRPLWTPRGAAKNNAFRSAAVGRAGSDPYGPTEGLWLLGCLAQPHSTSNGTPKPQPHSTSME